MRNAGLTGADRLSRKQKRLDRISRAAFIACAAFSAFAIAAITLFLLASGIPGLKEVGVFKFLFGTDWQPLNDSLPAGERFGILPMIVGTLYVTALSVALGGTIGVLTAIFIARFCPKRLKPIVRQAMNLLAGLPSVIYGFFGLVVLVPFVRNTAIGWGVDSARVNGFGVLVSALVLAVMILPTVVTLAVNALEAVPEQIYEGALALGGTKDQAVMKAVVPAARSGILAGVVLGTGRAMGETMAVSLVCGGMALMPNSLVTSMYTMTALIASEMSYAGELHRTMLIAAGFVLLVFVLLLTLSLNLIRRKKKSCKRHRS